MTNSKASSFFFPSSQSTISIIQRLSDPSMAAQMIACQHNPRLKFSASPNPRVIWQNPRISSPETRLLSKEDVAKKFALQLNNKQDDCFQLGTVDRYGGRGLGKNGGSGRSALLGTFYLKGIGKTPLLGKSTDESHASGGAYLEECAREIIVSEIVSAESPWGSVPVLSVCLTGESVVWQTSNGEKKEQLCTLVRPAFIRPAHFEKAIGYDPVTLGDLAIDEDRVSSHLSFLKNMCSDEAEIISVLTEFWCRWSEQIAYGFAHRLAAGGLSTANVALDGRWVDFGSWASLPSWGKYTFAPRVEPFGEEMVVLMQMIQAFFTSAWKRRLITNDLNTVVENVASLCTKSFQRRLLFEFLRVFGLSSDQAQAILEGPRVHTIFSLLASHILRFQRENLSIVYATEAPSTIWCPLEFWRQGKRDSKSLAAVLDDELSIFGESLRFGETYTAVVERAKFIGRSRDLLARDKMKTKLYQDLEPERGGQQLSEMAFRSTIDSMICQSRRDSQHAEVNSFLAGHARSKDCELSIFYNLNLSAYQCVFEWSATARHPAGAKLILACAEDRLSSTLEDLIGQCSLWVSG
jgi:hypothetical protein